MSTDLFHYRDYSHKLLAEYRSSTDFVPPDIDIQPTPKKKNITPRKSCRKQKTPQKLTQNNKHAIDSDSENEIFIPPKRPCMKLSFDENSECTKTNFHDNKLIHSNKNLLMKDKETSSKTGCFETCKNTDSCDILIAGSDFITDKNTPDSKSNQVKNMQPINKKSTNLVGKSCNKKISRTKIIQDKKKIEQAQENNVQKQTDLSKTNFDQEETKLNNNEVMNSEEVTEDVLCSETILNQCKKSLQNNVQVCEKESPTETELSGKKPIRAKKKLMINKKMNDQNDSKHNSNSDRVTKIKNLNQSSNVTKHIANKIGSKTRSTQNKNNIDFAQEIDLENSSNKRLLRTRGGLGAERLKINLPINEKIEELNQEFNEENISYNECKSTKSQIIKQNNFVNNSPNEKCVLRSSPRLKNGKSKNNQQINFQMNSIAKLSKTVVHQVKKKLDYNVENNKDAECSEIKNNQIKKNLLGNKIAKDYDETCDVPKSDQGENKLGNNTLLSEQREVEKDKNCSSANLIQHLSNPLRKNTNNNSLITNVDLDAKEEYLIMSSKEAAPEKGGVTDRETHTPPESPHLNASFTTTKPKEFNSPDVTINSANITANIDPQVILKTPKCVLTKLELNHQFLSPFQKINKLCEEKKEANEGENENHLDFDDIILGSRIDKELLRNLERDKSNSPTASLHSCSGDNIASASVSSESHVSSEKDEFDDSPSSPEVINPRNIKKKVNLLISSSSDSDLPLASLVQDKGKIKNNKSELNRKCKDGRVLRSLKTISIDRPTNCKSLSGSEMCPSSDNDSGKSTASKCSFTNSVVLEGKEVAGKVLRTPKKLLACLNGQSVIANTNSDINVCSDKDSDSGKSSRSKDSTFIPSERDSSSQPSDSTFSANSSENLVSSTSSTYISSGAFSSDNKSDDPSFSADTENTELVLTHKKRKENKISPKKIKNESQSLSEDSSEISQKEKLLFKRTKSSMEQHKDIYQQIKTDLNLVAGHESAGKFYLN